MLTFWPLVVLRVICAAILGFSLFALLEGGEGTNPPGAALAHFMMAGIVPLILTGSAIRSVFSQRAIKYRHVGTTQAGTEISYEFEPCPISGAEAQRLGYRRLIFPALTLLVLGAAVLAFIDWSQPFEVW